MQERSETIARLSALRVRLRTANPDDTVAFPRLLSMSLVILKMTEEDLAVAVSENRTTVKHWLMGKNVPEPERCKSMYEWLDQRAKEITEEKKKVAPGTLHRL